MLSFFAALLLVASSVSLGVMAAAVTTMGVELPHQAPFTTPLSGDDNKEATYGSLPVSSTLPPSQAYPPPYNPTQIPSPSPAIIRLPPMLSSTHGASPSHRMPPRDPGGTLRPPEQSTTSPSPWTTPGKILGEGKSRDKGNTQEFSPYAKVNPSGPGVDLGALEVELAGRGEEAGDLLLAISILQHHHAEQGPSTSPPWPSPSSSSPIPRTSRPQYTVEMMHQAGNNKEEEEDVAVEWDGPEEDEALGAGDGKGEDLETQGVGTPSEPPRYRWFVLVLDGNCSVIKKRMAAFVTYLKASLSARLSVGYEDVSVPAVYCDTAFMVNVSLDVARNPQAETRLRALARANTTLLEISREIFYLEKVLTQRGDHTRSLMINGRGGDLGVVVYLGVACMCVFILLSLLLLLLVRVCRNATHTTTHTTTTTSSHHHHHTPLPHHLPPRRPSVIYSHRFTEALVPGKCGGARRGAEEGGCGSSGGVAAVAVSTGGRGSTHLRYDSEGSGAGVMAVGVVDGVGGASHDDLYHDRRCLVAPSRKRVQHIPGQEVILEEELLEEEEEMDEDEEEDEDEDDDDEEYEEDEDESRRKRRKRRVSPDDDEVVILEEELKEVKQARRLRAVSSSKGIVRAVLGRKERGGHGEKGAGQESASTLNVDNPCYDR